MNFHNKLGSVPFLVFLFILFVAYSVLMFEDKIPERRYVVTDEKMSVATSTEDQYPGWSYYTHPKYGVTLRMPTDWTVVSETLDSKYMNMPELTIDFYSPINDSIPGHKGAQLYYYLSLGISKEGTRILGSWFANKANTLYMNALHEEEEIEMNTEEYAISRKIASSTSLLNEDVLKGGVYSDASCGFSFKYSKDWMLKAEDKCMVTIDNRVGELKGYFKAEPVESCGSIVPNFIVDGEPAEKTEPEVLGNDWGSQRLDSWITAGKTKGCVQITYGGPITKEMFTRFESELIGPILDTFKFIPYGTSEDISIEYPKGGEVFNRSQTYTLRFSDAALVENYPVSMYVTKEENKENTIEINCQNEGKGGLEENFCTWTIPSDFQTGQYMAWLRIEKGHQGTAYYPSKGYFSIQ